MNLIEINGKIDNNDLEHVLRLNKEMPIMAAPCPRKNGKINPQATRFLYKNGQMIDVFHIKPIYYEGLDEKFYPLSDVTYGFGNCWANLREDWDKKMHPRFLSWWMKRMDLIGGSVNYPFPKIGLKPLTSSLINFTVTTVYPDPDPETSTVDGVVRNTSVTSWADVRGATIGTTAEDTQSSGGFFQSAYVVATWYITRAMFLFDTSSIGIDSTISQAIFSVAGTGTAGADGSSTSIEVVDSSPATNTAIITDDFEQFTTTVYGEMSNGSYVITDGTYNNITLTTTTIVNKSSITKIGIRTGKDVDNSEPLLSEQNYQSCYFAEQAGTTSDPKLAVTYTPAVTARKNMLGEGLLLTGAGA